VQRAARQQELLRRKFAAARGNTPPRYGFPRIVGEHAFISGISPQIQRIGCDRLNSTAAGREWHGKGAVARAILILSKSPASNPSWPSTALRFPKAWLENELFGHERGLSPEAALKVGKIGLAHRGNFISR